MSDRAAAAWSNDFKVVSLISLAHGCSHFFQLVLPPLFPLLVAEFNTGYTELGVVMTIFFVTSGFSQVAAGFLVDRFGARRVLLSGLALYCFAIICFALAPAFWMFYGLAVLLGLGNSVFHPADFTIMNGSVDPRRLGRAFGMHTLGGNLGWAVAPGFMLSIALVGGWRVALLAAASLGIAILATLWWSRADLAEVPAADKDRPAARRTAPPLSLLVMISGPVILCFLYFALLALAQIAVQNFLPPTLEALHGTPLQIGNVALTGFLLGASAGVLTGGIMADRSTRYGLTIALGLAGGALMFVVVGNLALSDVVMVAGMVAAGFLLGMTTPSRDLLVRSATPKGATGRVFGFVYSGLDVGSALAPVGVGYMLDTGRAEWVLWLVAAILLLAITTAISVRPAQHNF